MLDQFYERFRATKPNYAKMFQIKREVISIPAAIELSLSGSECYFNGKYIQWCCNYLSWIIKNAARHAKLSSVFTPFA